MRKILVLGVVATGLFGAVGCGTSTGVPIEYAKACSTDNDKKVIEVSGFLDDKGGIFCSNIGGGPVRCGISLLETPQSEKASLSADIERGNSANEVEELKSGYKREDVKIHTNDGNLIGIGEKAKVTGTLNFVSGSDRCYVTVAKIEK